MRGWIENSLALVKDRLRGFPSVRRAKALTPSERDTCERYGEYVIGTILAGGLTLHQTDESREHARDWLTERADYREKWDQWKSFKADILEISVIALIGIEIALSLIFGGIGIYEGGKQAQVLDRQAKVLEHMDTSAAATADAMKAAKKSLESLAADQTKSLDRLKEMNDKLRASLTTTGTMASSTGQQLEILQQEQADRLAQRAKKPKLVLYVGGMSVVTTPQMAPLPPRQHTDTSLTDDLLIKNEGDATATNLLIRVTVYAKDVVTQLIPNAQQPIEPPDTPYQIFLIPVERLRPNASFSMSLSFAYPKGHGPFPVQFNADADELGTASPLGIFTVNPQNVK
jgi:hypothetical protein